MSSLQDGLVAKQICVENCDTVPLLNCILFNSLKIGLCFAIFSLSPPPNLESSGYQLPIRFYFERNENEVKSWKQVFLLS